MQSYTVTFIHPTANAEFNHTFAANDFGHAHCMAYRYINDKYGDILYLVGKIRRPRQFSSYSI